MDPKSKYGTLAPPQKPKASSSSAIKEERQRVLEYERRQRALRVLRIKSIVNPAPQPSSNRKLSETSTKRSSNSNSSSVATSKSSIGSLALGSLDGVYQSSYPRPADIRRMVKEELGENMPVPESVRSREKLHTRSYSADGPLGSRAETLNSLMSSLESVKEKRNRAASHHQADSLALIVQKMTDNMNADRDRHDEGEDGDTEGQDEKDDDDDDDIDAERQQQLKKMYPAEIWADVWEKEGITPPGQRRTNAIPQWFTFNDASPRNKKAKRIEDEDAGYSASSHGENTDSFEEEDSERDEEISSTETELLVEQPRLRLPKQVRQKVLPEPRPLRAMEENVVVPIWPDGYEPAEEAPTFQAPPPSYEEKFWVPRQGDKKSTLEEPPTQTPLLVYDVECGGPQVSNFEAGTTSINPQTFASTALVFESRFESGNLETATRVGSYRYELQLRRDSSTKGHTQWYYFRVNGLIPKIEYRFDIVNLLKSSSLYNVGLRPLMYSEYLAETKGIGWHRVGTNIDYYKNNTFADGDLSRPYHTLTFTVTLPTDDSDDTVYFAHCYPYTYTDLQRDLKVLKSDSNRSQYLRHTVIGHGVAGNHVDMLSVTSPATSPEELSGRQAIVVSARVHPGETNASYMMRGLMMFLTSEKPEARMLRDQFVIKVVPMLNPDGVIVGNYRCNILGYDLNRQWKPSSTEWSVKNTPEIHAVKSMIARTSAVRDISLYCDLHGHNRKQGIFIYGCHNNNSNATPSIQPETKPKSKNSKSRPNSSRTKRPASSPGTSAESLAVCNTEEREPNPLLYRERVFPLMLSRSVPSLFYFRRCQFKMQRSKEGTGRITVRKEFNVIDSFTLEASFCGSDGGSSLSGGVTDNGFHYSTRDLEKMGERIGMVLVSYFLEVEDDENREGGKRRVAERIHKEVLDGFEEGRRDLQPDLSASSETTSDDEVLRIKTKKKKSLKKKRDLPPSLALHQHQPQIEEADKISNAPPSRPQSRSGSKVTLVERPKKKVTKLEQKPKTINVEVKRPRSANGGIVILSAKSSNVNPIMLELSPKEPSLDSFEPKNHHTESSFTGGGAPTGVFAFPVSHNEQRHEKQRKRKTSYAGALAAGYLPKDAGRPLTAKQRHVRSQSATNSASSIHKTELGRDSRDVSQESLESSIAMQRSSNESLRRSMLHERFEKEFTGGSEFRAIKAGKRTLKPDRIKMSATALHSQLGISVPDTKFSVQQIEYSTDSLVHILFSKPRKKGYESMQKARKHQKGVRKPWDTNRVLELRE
ncbi:Cytosolic carboxypeptidase 2 [Phlyctochytrium planicorne]|nr:Cytosolic carboxypeptidase 2 [Phlyctochytrium planicorne]